MQESVIYQDILLKGERLGELKGRQEGERQEAFKFLNLIALVEPITSGIEPATSPARRCDRLLAEK